MDQLHCMRVFTRVVEHGSFARAAESLDLPRPSVTTAVASLEKRLGVRLLHRTTRRLSLTDEGRAFYEGCVRILDDLAETEDSLSSGRSAPRGRLRVSTPNSFARQVFYPALERFLARYPELGVEVVMTDRAVNLVEEGIDCAVRAVHMPDDSTLIARRISSVVWLTCASPAYLAKHGRPERIVDLERHHCIRFISPSAGRTTDWRFKRGTEEIAFTPQGSFGVTSLEGAAAAAAAGIGIAQVSDALTVEWLRAGQLEPLLLDWAAPGPPLTVVYPSSRYLTAKVRVFSDFIAENFRPEGYWPEILEIAKRKNSGSEPEFP